MKRLVVALAAVGVLAIGSVGAAFAQTPTPPTNPYGWGHMGYGYGNYDPTSDPTIKRLADKIGIAPADLVQGLRNGQSVVDVAAGKVSEQDLVNVLLQPQIDALNLQVKYGYLTQDQANSVQTNMANQAKFQLEQRGLFDGSNGNGYGYGYGIMGGFGGMMGGFGPGYGGGMMGGFGGMMGRGFGFAN